MRYKYTIIIVLFLLAFYLFIRFQILSITQNPAISLLSLIPIILILFIFFKFNVRKELQNAEKSLVFIDSDISTWKKNLVINRFFWACLGATVLTIVFPISFMLSATNDSGGDLSLFIFYPIIAVSAVVYFGIMRLMLLLLKKKLTK